MSQAAPKLLVAQRIGVEREATLQEKCSHWWIPTGASSGGKQYTRCSFCGLPGRKEAT